MPASQVRPVGACGARSAVSKPPSRLSSSQEIPPRDLLPRGERGGASGRGTRQRRGGRRGPSCRDHPHRVAHACCGGFGRGPERAASGARARSDTAACVADRGRTSAALPSGPSSRQAVTSWLPAGHITLHPRCDLRTVPRIGTSFCQCRLLRGPQAVRRAYAATAVGVRERMLWGAPAAASRLSVAAEVAPAAVSNARTVVSPELVISTRVCLRLPT